MAGCINKANEKLKELQDLIWKEEASKNGGDLGSLGSESDSDDSCVDSGSCDDSTDDDNDE